MKTSFVSNLTSQNSRLLTIAKAQLELVKLEHWGRKWTWTCFRHGNGSKQLGFRFWWNDQRVGLEMNF